MQIEKPLSFKIYSIFTWLTKPVVIFGVIYLINYINEKESFYLGIGLKDIRIYLYIYVAIAIVNYMNLFRVFAQKKFNYRLYFLLKIVELTLLILTVPNFMEGLARAFSFENGWLYQLTIWTLVTTTNLIFPLIYVTYYKLYK